MGCFDDIEFSRFLDDDLSPTREKEVLDHLKRCENCQSLVEQLKKENLGIKKIFEPGNKFPDLTQRLMTKISENENIRRSKFSFFTPQRILVSAAALCLVVLLFFLFVMNTRLDQSAVEQEVLIQNARVEGKPVMTHVFNARDMDLKFIWLEKI